MDRAGRQRREDRALHGQVSVRRAVPAGLVDAALASLASFIVTLYAARFLDANDLALWANADERFHGLLVERCGNRRLARMLATVMDQYHRARMFTLRLRQGHRWSDGHPFTSEDLRFFWEDVALDLELSPSGPEIQLLVDGDLDRLSVAPDRHTGGHFSLRWILVHVIAEYARHLGHADLLRERIDGVTGE